MLTDLMPQILMICGATTVVLLIFLNLLVTSMRIALARAFE